MILENRAYIALKRASSKHSKRERKKTMWPHKATNSCVYLHKVTFIYMTASAASAGSKREKNVQAIECAVSCAQVWAACGIPLPLDQVDPAVPTFAQDFFSCVM